MFEIFKKKNEELIKHNEDIVNRALSNLYLLDIYNDIPTITLDGQPNQIQSARMFFSESSELAITLARPIVLDGVLLHIFYGGFYVLETNENERMFIVLGRSDDPITNLDSMKENQSALKRPFNNIAIMQLTLLLNELAEEKLHHYEAVRNYVFDRIYRYYTDSLCGHRIQRHKDADGFIYCVVD